MNAYNIYIAALLASGIVSLLTAFWIWRMTPERLCKWESLPRNKYLGVVLAFLCLLWCVPQARPIVWDWMLAWLYPLVAVFTVLGYFFLDYLFSRALGGLFILLTYYFVHEGFTFHTPAIAFFAVACWILGIAGLFISGKPHLLRDFIRKITKSVSVRYVSSLYFIVFGLMTVTLGLMHLNRG